MGNNKHLTYYQTTTMVLLFSLFARVYLFCPFAFGFNLTDEIPIKDEFAKFNKQGRRSLLEKGVMDQKTMVTYSIKAYVTPDVTATYPNYTESVEYLIDILNKQYKRSQVPVRAKLHCIEETNLTESEGINKKKTFENYKGGWRRKHLYGSADLVVLFAMEVFIGNQSLGGYAAGRLLGCNFPESLRTRIILGHELGHNFGLKHDDGYHFSAGGRKLGTLMRTREVEAGHCRTDDYGFYSNPNVMIDGVAAGNETHNSAAIITRKRFLMASHGDESIGCNKGGSGSGCGNGDGTGNGSDNGGSSEMVNCGAHKAKSCADCPQGQSEWHGRAWCNGECHWARGYGCLPKE